MTGDSVDWPARPEQHILACNLEVEVCKHALS
jgi:hypothetical protein